MPAPNEYRPERLRIDLNATPVLPERPDAAGPRRQVRSDAAAAITRLQPVIAKTRRTTLASIILLDMEGRAASGNAAGNSYASLPEVRAALSGRADTVLRHNASYRATYRFEWLSRAAAIRVHHARPIIVNGRVVGVLLLSRSARSLFRGIYEDRGKIVIGVVAIFALLVVLSGLLSRGISRPIEALGVATRAVASGRGTIPPVPQTATIEIQGLYADFAAMAIAIEHRSRYLRDFAHAVSHEFKTPLAGIRGVLELLADHGAEMSADERARFLANADADAGRLTLLVTRLLDLARADMTVEDAGSAALGPVLARVAVAHRGAGFAVTLPEGALPDVAVSETTLEAVLGTLLENSRQAGAGGVKITVFVKGGLVAIVVGDDGPGVPAADRERIFEPFFTTKRTENGTGLGLPIVRSLLATAGGTIVLSAASPGACFEIMVPLRPASPGRRRSEASGRGDA